MTQQTHTESTVSVTNTECAGAKEKDFKDAACRCYYCQHSIYGACKATGWIRTPFSPLSSDSASHRIRVSKNLGSSLLLPSLQQYHQKKKIPTLFVTSRVPPLAHLPQNALVGMA